MCKYCDQLVMCDFPEEHASDNEFKGRVFDTCIDKRKKGWYMEFPNSPDIPINYCPFCGEKLL
jgi:hypothetical protein